MKGSKLYRVAAALVAGVLLTLGLGACGGSGSGYAGDYADVAYQPDSWGPTGVCYYVAYPDECVGRYGPNHMSLAPVLMPLMWHAMYASYYDSPAYVRTYVPASYRTVYVTHVHVFESQNRSTIATASAKASWLGSNGKKVTGAQLGSSPVFKAGNMRSSGFSSGSLRSSSSSSSRSGSGSSGFSFGKGSTSRSGSSSGKSCCSFGSSFGKSSGSRSHR